MTADLSSGSSATTDLVTHLNQFKLIAKLGK
jgi:RimJ/RimL family protein N-acetyltransferase